VILLSHFGRSKGPDPAQSLELLTPAIAAVLKRPVAFAEGCIGERACGRGERQSTMATRSFSARKAGSSRRQPHPCARAHGKQTKQDRFLRLGEL
jgi:hypothetical protein